MSRITVGIAAGESRDAHVSRSNECPPITDRASLGHVANQSDPRFPCHGRLQDVLKFRQRRNAVEDDARAHNFECRLLKSERARALQNVRFVAPGNFSTKSPNDFTKARKLIARVSGVLVTSTASRR